MPSYLAGLESLGELVGYSAVFDPVDEMGTREAPLPANAGGRDGALSILSVFCQRVRRRRYASAIPYPLHAIPLVVLGVGNWQMIAENTRWGERGLMLNMLFTGHRRAQEAGKTG